MDEQVSASLQQRVERMEASIASLQRTVDQLGNEVRHMASRAAPIPAQVYCPRCNGGNPPNGAVCMWCGLPLAAPAPGSGATDPRLRMQPNVFAGPPVQ